MVFWEHARGVGWRRFVADAGVCVCACALFLQFRNNLFLGTTRQYLTQLHDDQHGNLYSKISAIIVPLGFLFVTIVGWLMDKCVTGGT